MKKIVLNFLFTLIALSLSSVANLYAKDPVSVTSGEISIMKKPSTALLEFDYSKTKVGEQTLDEYLQGRGNDFVRDWPKDSEKAAVYFTTQFNKKNKKGMQLKKDASDAAFKLVVHVNTLDMGNGGSSFAPLASAKAGGCIMSGTVDIVDLKTGEAVCTVSVDGVKGIGHPSETVRLGMMYLDMATRMCKLK